jgi:hypothetical protein
MGLTNDNVDRTAIAKAHLVKLLVSVHPAAFHADSAKSPGAPGGREAVGAEVSDT